MTEPNSATADETETGVESPSDVEVTEEFTPFSELSDDYRPSVIQTVRGPDGLPMQTSLDNNSDIPPLSCESLVCMEDTSEFVVRDRHFEIKERYTPSAVERKPDGKWYLQVAPSMAWQEVQPIRPRCKHYIRQLTQLDSNAQHKLHARLCAARRTTEGTFMTLRDTAMWACSMREPRDLKSEKLLEDFDTKKMEEGLNRVEYSIFGDMKGS